MKGWLIFIIVFFSLAAIAGIVTGIILSKKRDVTTYSCNSATEKCEKNKNGNYKSLKDCENNCKKISPGPTPGPSPGPGPSLNKVIGTWLTPISDPKGEIDFCVDNKINLIDFASVLGQNFEYNSDNSTINEDKLFGTLFSTKVDLKGLQDATNKYKGKNVEFFISFGGSNNTNWDPLLGPPIGKATGGGTTTCKNNGKSLTKAWNCNGHTPNVKMQPLIPGTNCCCDWGYVPKKDNSGCEINPRACQNFGGAYACAKNSCYFGENPGNKGIAPADISKVECDGCQDNTCKGGKCCLSGTPEGDIIPDSNCCCDFKSTFDGTKCSKPGGGGSVQNYCYNMTGDDCTKTTGGDYKDPNKCQQYCLTKNVDALLSLMDKYNIVGIDFDMEGFTPEYQENVKQLATALKSRGKKIMYTILLGSPNIWDQLVPEDSSGNYSYDYLSLMLYNGGMYTGASGMGGMCKEWSDWATLIISGCEETGDCKLGSSIIDNVCKRVKPNSVLLGAITDSSGKGGICGSCGKQSFGTTDCTNIVTDDNCPKKMSNIILNDIYKRANGIMFWALPGYGNTPGTGSQDTIFCDLIPEMLGESPTKNCTKFPTSGGGGGGGGGGGKCSGNRCPLASQCRSQYNNCGTSPAYCNKDSIWTNACPSSSS